MMPHVRGQDADLRRPIAQPPYLLFVFLEVPRRHPEPQPPIFVCNICCARNRWLAQWFRELASFSRAATKWWEGTVRREPIVATSSAPLPPLAAAGATNLLVK
jgi:hypothetical protein